MKKISNKSKRRIKKSVYWKMNLKLFSKYSYSGWVNKIKVTELMAINISKSNIIVSYTLGRNQIKSIMLILERLTNSLIYHERNNNKKNDKL